MNDRAPSPPAHRTRGVLLPALAILGAATAAFVVRPRPAGTTARMKIPGEEPLAFRLVHVGPDGFEDETPIPGADVVVRVRHTIEPLAGGRSRVVYRATVDGPNAEKLGSDIGPQVTADFPDVLAALKARAEASPRT